MPTPHFTPAAFDWFDGLEEDNSRAYFTGHAEVYKRELQAPFHELLGELAKEFGGEVHVFRPNRDVRFSPDKRPYKSNISGTLQGRAGGAGDLYVQLAGDGMLAGCGYFVMATDQLARFRAVLTDPKKGAAEGKLLARLMEEARGAGLDVEGEQLKTAPRGIARDAANIELLRFKSLTASAKLSPDDTTRPGAALEWTARTWRAGLPLLEWLDKRVGKSTLPPPTR